MFIDLMRDWKRIADQRSVAGASRWDLWRTHVALNLSSAAEGKPGHADILGYRMEHLDHVNLVHLFREIFVSRLYDVPLASSAPRIIDCGSNIGMSILFFKTLYPKARILGFEPHPAVHETLARNVTGNGLTDVQLVQKALSDRPGKLEFFVNDAEPGALDMGLFAGRTRQSAITVEADVLSGFIDEEVDLLKLDIEGAEEVVLAELASTNKLRHVRHIVCEYHHHIADREDRLSHTLATFEAAGFGYQVAAYCGRATAARTYQDIVIYAYRRDPEDHA